MFTFTSPRRRTPLLSSLLIKPKSSRLPTVSALFLEIIHSLLQVSTTLQGEFISVIFVFQRNKQNNWQERRIFSISQNYFFSIDLGIWFRYFLLVGNRGEWKGRWVCLHLDLSLHNHQVFWQRMMQSLKECWKAVIRKRINWRFKMSGFFAIMVLWVKHLWLSERSPWISTVTIQIHCLCVSEFWGREAVR